MNTRKLTFLLLFATFLMATSVLAVSPFGAGVTQVATQRAPADSAGNNSAIAGNVTELTITGFSVTQVWQGYYGNVSGTVMLADASDNVMYNWSLASPEGEVFASTNSSITWAYTQCLNFSSAGTYASDTANAGATSQFGTNLTQLEARFGLASDDVDGVNETFSLTGTHESGAGLAHDLFYVNNLQFSAGECLSTHVRSNGGTLADGTFQEVLLYEPSTSSVIFTALLDEEGPAGFDAARHDFEMLVLEDGHGTDTSTTTYFFYVELE